MGSLHLKPSHVELGKHDPIDPSFNPEPPPPPSAWLAGSWVILLSKKAPAPRLLGPRMPGLATGSLVLAESPHKTCGCDWQGMGHGMTQINHLVVSFKGTPGLIPTHSLLSASKKNEGITPNPVDSRDPAQVNFKPWPM